MNKPYTLSSTAVGLGLYGVTEDRNGNQVQSPILEHPLDTLGRQELTFNIATVNGLTASADITVSELQNSYHLRFGTVNLRGGSGWTSPTQVYTSQLSCQIDVGEFSNADGSTNMPTSLELPDGTSYQFSYDPNYAMLNKLVYPNGACVTYTWGMPGGVSDQANGFWLVPITRGNDNDDFTTETEPEYCNFRYALPVLTHREVSFDGSTIAQTQDFSYTTTFDQPLNTSAGQWSSKTTTVLTKDNLSGLAYTTVYSYIPTSAYQSSIPITYGDTGDSNQIFSSFQASGNPAVESAVVVKDSSGKIIRTTYKTWDSPITPLDGTNDLGEWADCRDGLSLYWRTDTRAPRKGCL